MEQERKAEENSENLKDNDNGLDLNKYVEELLLHLKQLEKRILEFEKVKEYKDFDYVKKRRAELQFKIASLKDCCKNLSFQITEFSDSEEWKELVRLSDKLELLSQKIEKFIDLFSGRKKVNEEFLKKIDFIIMNEAIKNEMVSHIFDMLNRGESKDKVMIASLEFVYFLKEIESDETLKELKELKNLILTTQKEEANIHHFLEKLKDKIRSFSKSIESPTKRMESLKSGTDEIKSRVEKIVVDVEGQSKEVLKETEGK